MTQQEIDKQVAKALRQLADEKDPPGVNQVRPRPEYSTSESAQEAHEKALASFNTVVKDGVRQSLCSAMSSEQAQALLKKIDGK